MGPSTSQKNNRVSVTKSSPMRQILRPLMVTSDDLMVIDAPVGSHSARWVTTQLTAVDNIPPLLTHVLYIAKTMQRKNASNKASLLCSTA
jgi:hypothetical protein